MYCLIKFQSSYLDSDSYDFSSIAPFQVLTHFFFDDSGLSVVLMGESDSTMKAR